MTPENDRFTTHSTLKAGEGLRIDPGEPGPIEVVYDPLAGLGRRIAVTVRAPTGTKLRRFVDYKPPVCPDDGGPMRMLRKKGAVVWVCKKCRLTIQKTGGQRKESGS